MNGTRAALAVVASLLCPEQGVPLTQCVEQRCAWIERQPVNMVIELQCHDQLLGCEGCVNGRRFLSAGDRRQQCRGDAGN
jgi:hypothetical protein